MTQLTITRPATAAPALTAVGDSDAEPVADRGMHLGHLDGIRGGAALWVLCAHCSIWGGWLGFHIPDAKIAVDIFMVVSGYLMSYHFLARQRQAPFDAWRTVRAFWLRRFFRIAPVYYVVLATVFALGPHVRNGYVALWRANPQIWAGDFVHDPARAQFTVSNFLAHVTFVFGLIPKQVRATLLPDWSIGLEMQFYALFPVLFMIVRRWGYLAAAAVGVVSTIAVKSWFATLPGVYPGTTEVFPEPSFLPLKIALFLSGMLAAESHASFTQKSERGRLLAVIVALALASRQSAYVLATLGILLYLGARTGPGGDSEESRLSQLLDQILSNRLTRFLADTSYAVYLTHGLFISLIGGWCFAQPWFRALSGAARVSLLTSVVMLGCYPVAYLLHRWVEKPGIELGRRVADEKRVT